MRDVPAHERPRERMARHGAETLSDSELLSALLGSGSRNESVIYLADRMLADFTLEELSGAGVNELKRMPGIDSAKACRIMAAMELGRRAASGREKTERFIDGPSDVAKLMAPSMRNLKKEFFRGLYLNSKKKVVRDCIISIGGLNTNAVHPREVFGPAVRECADAVILVHNHPSGDPAPSKRDIESTKKLARAGRLLGVELVDHVIIAKNGYVSLKEEGLV